VVVKEGGREGKKGSKKGEWKVVEEGRERERENKVKEGR
jgi:hypothetical protein